MNHNHSIALDKAEAFSLIPEPLRMDESYPPIVIALDPARRRVTNVAYAVLIKIGLVRVCNGRAVVVVIYGPVAIPVRSTRVDSHVVHIPAGVCSETVVGTHVPPQPDRVARLGVTREVNNRSHPGVYGSAPGGFTKPRIRVLEVFKELEVVRIREELRCNEEIRASVNADHQLPAIEPLLKRDPMIESKSQPLVKITWQGNGWTLQ